MSIGVGVIGLGFMGRTHVDAYAAANEAGFANHLVAVADRNEAALSGERPGAKGNLEGGATGLLFDPAKVATSTDSDDVFKNPDVQLVSICTHTRTHVELAKRALAAGKHVVLEKPIALTSAEVAELIEAERSATGWVMPAMCMRFWPGWSWLKEAVDSGEHGKVRSAVFRRLAFPPNWSPEFYAKSSENGGALFDLHVHDADLVRWLFGEPTSVSATGSLDHLTASYSFADGPAHVIAEGGWDHTPGYEFRMSYTVIFDEATAEFELGHEPTWTLAQNGQRKTLTPAEGTGYDHELRHALQSLATSTHPHPRLQEALGLTRMLETEEKAVSDTIFPS